MSKKQKTIVFLSWGGGGGIFLTSGQYDRDSKIQSALETARTWGEFRDLLPEDEFEQLGHWWCNDGDQIYEDNGSYSMIDESDLAEFWDCAGEDYIIRSSDDFDPMRIWGYGDGDYPGTHNNTCDTQLPGEFVREYAEPVSSMVSGGWNEYPEAKMDEMTAFLERHGYKVLKNLEMDLTKPLSELE